MSCAGALMSMGRTLTATGNFRRSARGYHHNCAITTSGEVECWGTFNRTRADRQLPPPGSFAMVSAGFRITHAACAMEAAWSVGAVARPVKAPKVPSRAISAGQFHNCGILTSGAVRCWGEQQRRAASPCSTL